MNRFTFKLIEKKEFDFLLKQGEGLKIEFKEGKSGIDKDMVAFSNAEGGRIFIGITDKGDVKGTEITNKIKSEIQDLARNCDPSIDIEIETFDNLTSPHSSK